MDTLGTPIGIGRILTGLTSLGLSIPLITGRVGPNSLYGVRFPQSFQSDEAWLAINRFGGWRLAVWSVPMMVVGLVTLFLPLEGKVGFALLLGFGPFVFVLIALLEAWRFARRFRLRT